MVQLDPARIILLCNLVQSPMTEAGNGGVFSTDLELLPELPRTSTHDHAV